MASPDAFPILACPENRGDRCGLRYFDLQKFIVADLAPAHLKATALGVFHTAIGLVALPGGYIAGTLWDRIRPEATFAYGLTLAVLALLLFLFVKTPAAYQER